MARVFISHAGDGTEQAREVYRWLVEDSHTVFLDQDRRDGLVAGTPWREHLHERLRWADAVVCVVTSAYPASRWCAAEVEIAWSRGSRLLPLRVEPGVVDPALESLQHIDLVGDPAQARAELVAVLRRVDAAGGSGWPDDRSPFPGLKPFDIDQHQVFFGRPKETKELAELLRSPTLDTGHAALLVVGPSGCGKSSLVRAGLLPVTAAEPGWWTLRPIVPGTDPVRALARELAAAARRMGLAWTVAQVHQQLDHEGLGGLVDELLLAASGGPQRRLLVVVDQAEELLTQTASADRIRFVELLSPARSGPVQLVATLRSEFLDPLLNDAALDGMATHVYPLRQLGQEALRSVIKQPARLAGIAVDPELVDRLVQDTGTGDALPLLAFTLAELAQGVSRGGQLSGIRYDQLGGVQGALTRQARQALAAAVRATGLSEREVIAGLLWLATVDEQDRPTRWRIRRDQLPTPVAIALDAFVERRLLTTDDSNNGPVIDVAHEAFLSAWPPLRDAIAASVAALRARRTIEYAATAWQENGRPRSSLWDGSQLTTAVADTGTRIQTKPEFPPPLSMHAHPRWRPPQPPVLVTDRIDLSSTAREFLHNSIRRVRYRRRRTNIVLAALLSFALVSVSVAIIQYQTAQLQLTVATARQLIAQADAIRDTDPRTALQLGLAAQSIHPGAETRSGLFKILINTSYRTPPPRRGAPVVDPSGRVSSVALAPGGKTLAVTSEDGTVRRWDFTDPARPQQLSQSSVGHPSPVSSTAITPNGPLVVTVNDGSVVLQYVGEGQQQDLEPSTDVPSPVSSVALAPDGHTLVTASETGTVIRWDLTGPPELLSRPFVRHDDLVFSVAFAPDRPASDRTTRGGPAPNWPIVATVGDNRSVVSLRDLGEGQQLESLIAQRSPVFSIALAPDGQTLAVADENGTVILWDLIDLTRPQQLGQPLIGQTRPVSSMAFAPDGQTLAVADENGTVILWDLSGLNDLRDHLKQRVCSMTEQGLDRYEWASYIPELPYNQTC